MIDDSVFLKPFFSQLNKLNVQYGVMRNYKTLPSSLGGSDLDILISVKDISIFYSVFNKLLEEVNGNVILKSKGLVPKICILGRSKINYYGFMLDVHHGIIPYKTSSIISADFIFSRTKLYNNVWVFDENDANFIAFLKEIFYNKKCEKYFVQAKKAWSLNKKEYIVELNSKYSNTFVTLLDYVLCLDKYDTLKVNKLGVIGSKELTYGFSKKIEILKSFMTKTHRFIRPFGYTIAFLGVDGSGKTSVINKITPLLKQAVHNENHYEHMRPNLLPSIATLFGEKEKNEPVSNPHKKEASGFLGSIFRLFYYSLDYIFGYWIKVYPSLVRKPSLWIFDRYFYDYLIDPKRGRINLPKWIIQTIKFFIPKPNLIICLGGDPKVIFERKKELPFSEIEKQVTNLKKFAETEKNVFWVNTTQDIEITVEEVVELIKKRMNSQFLKNSK